eukprot:TRINITY_DN11033_c0_g1_i1.p1 TRINITY_DN11033_c0_g1~~TRINITY_DN11033_c0_g1_i1.p1  ORF type:complete len:268 (+),score=22.69 TRINITY_DN11033_c0_g1_i1:112-915(+)
MTPFSKHVVSGVRRSKGACLGLSLAQMLTRYIGSEGIEFITSKGSGTTFSFCVPLRQQRSNSVSVIQGSFLDRLDEFEDEYIPIEIENAMSDKNIVRSLAIHNRSQSVVSREEMKGKRMETEIETPTFQCACKRILVVDDNPYNIYVMKRKLASRGYEIFDAMNGSLALVECERIFREIPKCGGSDCHMLKAIFMDVDMPELNGIDATIRITAKMTRCEWPRVPVIGCSAFDSENDISEALKAGMTDYMSKPIKDEKLDLILKKLTT